MRLYRNVISFIGIDRTDVRYYTLVRTFSEQFIFGGTAMEDTKEIEELEQMTNEEYREELNKIFSDIHENYKLRWFYVFITEKLRSSH